LPAAPPQTLSLLPGSLRLVRLLSIATMRPLRLPPSLPRSLRFPSLAESFALPRAFARRGREERGPDARTLVNRCRPNPVVCRRIGAGSQLSRVPHVPLPRSQTPVRPPCTWPASHSRDVLLCARRCCPSVGYPNDIPVSGFNHAALALAPYASCTPCRNAMQCSLPSGCQPFSGGSVYPLGYHYHVSLPFGCFLMFWLLARDPIGWIEILWLRHPPRSEISEPPCLLTRRKPPFRPPSSRNGGSRSRISSRRSGGTRPTRSGTIGRRSGIFIGSSNPAGSGRAGSTRWSRATCAIS
jgi:hypothetical protein